MHLYLLRHADADTVSLDDDERVLSEKGINQAQRVARFCEAHEIKPALMLGYKKSKKSSCYSISNLIINKTKYKYIYN